MNASSVEHFYDTLTDSYDRIFPNWEVAVRWQGEIIGGLIGAPSPQPISILDCSCGIGTQAIGLAQQGFTVHATDISSQEIARAEQEAHAMGVDVTFGVADFRELTKSVSGTFDVVISFDNSLSHLLTDADLSQALTAMRSKLTQRGRIFISIRDYDHLLTEKPTGTLPRSTVTPEGQRVYFQTWEWEKENPIYTTTIFILSSNDHSWDVSSGTTTLRALQRDELTQLLFDAGFQDTHWLMPKESGYYQPIVSASAS